MKTANLSDLGNPLSHLIQWLEQGETVQLLRQGKPFARIQPEPAVEVEERKVVWPDFKAQMREDFGDKVFPDSMPMIDAMREERF